MHFHCLDTGAKANETYDYPPLIPNVGDFVFSGLFEQTGKKRVVSIAFGYSYGQNSVTIIVENESKQ